nr:proline-rich protein HaeIII subfamily 1-like [Dasypus novemcinctus]
MPPTPGPTAASPQPGAARETEAQPEAPKGPPPPHPQPRARKALATAPGTASTRLPPLLGPRPRSRRGLAPRPPDCPVAKWRTARARLFTPSGPALTTKWPRPPTEGAQPESQDGGPPALAPEEAAPSPRASPLLGDQEPGPTLPRDSPPDSAGTTPGRRGQLSRQGSWPGRRQSPASTVAGPARAAGQKAEAPSGTPSRTGYGARPCPSRAAQRAEAGGAQVPQAHQAPRRRQEEALTAQGPKSGRTAKRGGGGFLAGPGLPRAASSALDAAGALTLAPKRD